MAPPKNSAALDAAKPEDKKPLAKPEEEKVAVDKKTLDIILGRLETLEDESKKKDAQIEMLKEVADKGRLARYENKEGELISTARIAHWEGLPILAWKLTKDEVYFREGRLITNQIVTIFIDAGEKEPVQKELEYLYWTQNVRSQVGEVTAKTETKEGKFWTVQLKDGKKITVDIRFINAF